MIKGFFKSIKKRLSAEDNTRKQIIVETIKTATGKTIQKKYIKHRLLGAGAFAQCYETQNLETKKRYATKIIAKDSRNRIKMLNELVIHQLLHHPNIVDFSHAFENRQFVYVFMQLCPNKTLQDLLNQKRTLPTSEVKRFLSEIIEGVKYIHSKNLIHRDLKPRNIFLGENNTVKIGDFGLACKLQFEQDKKRNLCGTPQYMPPQVIECRSYGKQVDVWAIGILLYEMYTRKTPFVDSTTDKIMENICNLDYKISVKGIPKDALSLIKRILIKNSELRPTLQQILESPFMRSESSFNFSIYQPSNYNSFNLNFQESSFRNSINNRSRSVINRSNLYISKKCSIPYIVQIEEIGAQIILYRMSNRSVGAFHKNKEIIHQGYSKINLVMEDVLFDTKKLVNNDQEENVKLKQLLKNFKARKHIRGPRVSNRDVPEQEIYLTEHSKHRNIIILRLSNNYLQLLFDDKTSILVNLSKSCQNIIYIDDQDKTTEINMKELTRDTSMFEKILQRQKIEYLMRIRKSIGKNKSNGMQSSSKLSKMEQQSIFDQTIC